MVCQEFSNTPPQERQEVLKSLPTTKPVLRAGRQLFHRSHEAGGSAAQAERDFSDMEKQLQAFFETYEFPPSAREEWGHLIQMLKWKQVRPSKNLPDTYFWPLSVEDVKEQCGEDDEDDEDDYEELQAADLRQRALAHARTREQNRFRGMMCGPGIRYKSTEPKNATRGNIVVIRNKIPVPESLHLGKYESLFSIGKVLHLNLAT